jgi:hypothetical protein
VDTHRDNYASQPTTIAQPDGNELSPRSKAILAFERRWWRHAGAKEEAIRRDLGLRPADYYQALSRLLDDPAALAADPSLIVQLRRLRATRHRRRASRSLGPNNPSGD